MQKFHLPMLMRPVDEVVLGWSLSVRFTEIFPVQRCFPVPLLPIRRWRNPLNKSSPALLDSPEAIHTSSLVRRWFSVPALLPTWFSSTTRSCNLPANQRHRYPDPGSLGRSVVPGPAMILGHGTASNPVLVHDAVLQSSGKSKPPVSSSWLPRHISRPGSRKVCCYFHLTPPMIRNSTLHIPLS